MAEEYSIVYMNHTFLIQSSADGHLDRFQISATARCAAVNTRVFDLYE